MKLLTKGDSVYKIKKSNDAETGYNTNIMYLAPQKTSLIGNVCPFASKGCIASCLFTAGRGGMYSVQQARINRTKMWYNDRPAFLKQLNEEIQSFIKRCEKNDWTPTIRLNGTSDISFEQHLNMGAYPNVQFYDYTKNTKRMFNFMQGQLPDNYHLTFSRSEDNEEDALTLKRIGANVAVVFHPDVPERWKRFKTFSADDTDLRFLDPPNGIAALKAKGKAKKDTTGFVVRV